MHSLKVAEAAVTANVDLWTQEYATSQIIPSTTRTRPSKALLAFAELLELRNEKCVLDAGCGNGRNAVYLASRECRVKAVDFCSIAQEKASRLAQEEGVEDRIEWLNQSLLRPLPFRDSFFDAVLDIYTSCHFVDQHEWTLFWSETLRVAKKDRKSVV